MPYENLSKIVRSDECGPGAKRSPGRVIDEHVRFGSGGTCFALTAALTGLLRALGWRAEPILADRHYGEDTHCALLVWIDERPHLLDPGYLVLRPVPLADDEVRLAGTFTDVILRPQLGGDRLELHTERGSNRSHRLTFKTQPVDADEFVCAWDRSFTWDMMRYPVLTTVQNGEHVYLQGCRAQVRSRERTRREEIDPAALAATIAATFGIDRRLVERALSVLRSQGERLDGCPRA